MPNKPMICAAMAAALLAAAPVSAQETKPLELRHTSGAPPKTVWAMQAERAAKNIDEESRGTLKIEVFLNSQLGAETDTVQQVARGRIDMGSFSMNAVALMVPELSLIAMPFYFRSPAELDCVLDTALTRPVAELLSARGIHFLSWNETGMLDLIGKKPFLLPADINGVKAGTYGTKVYTTFWSALGANPTQMNAVETSSGFQTGLVDVYATVAAFYVPSGLGKVAPVLTRLDVAPLPIASRINKGVYDRLTPDQQRALERASARAPAAQTRKEVREFEATMRSLHERNGGQVVKASPEQREAWRRVVEPLYPRMAQDAGPGGPKFFEQMEAGRKACEKRG
jgi:TRAP-type C4-dicarboxylate transport system substrate-binding protein